MVGAGQHQRQVERGHLGQVVLEVATAMSILPHERLLTINDLLAAKEVFLTNAVQGIRWVVGYRQKRYFNQNSKRLLLRLNEKVRALYEFS